MKKLTSAAVLASALLLTGCEESKTPSALTKFNPNKEEFRAINDTFAYTNPDLISYSHFKELLQDNGGVLNIPVVATSVTRGKDKTNWGDRGYGFAWTREMKGTQGNYLVELITTQEGSSAEMSPFTNRGYGFGWAKTMSGSIGGLEFQLRNTGLKKEKTGEFISEKGFGYGSTRQMKGNIFDDITVTLDTTTVGKDKDSNMLSNKGYGYGWANRANLRFELKQ